MVSLDRSSLFSLDGRTAVLTGASGFLGRTMALALLENGARVVILGRSDRIHHCAAEWTNTYGTARVHAHQVDMYELDRLSDTFQRIVEQEDRIDVLVNNAHELGPATGFNVPEGALGLSSLEHWQRHVTGGVFWPLLAVQSIGAKMRQAGRGSIVNVSTMYAQVAPNPLLYADTSSLNPPGYSAAKAAMLAFTRYVASFWGPDGVRANAILPGPFSNTEDIGPNTVQDPMFLRRLQERTCLRRVGRPDELAGALLFLASDASSYVTGHALLVDGGWTTT
ncbi:MAG TPA: SDR family oxidoreductase [Vicinamibacterales bacterium]|nr:SDR family oxidoreductase [Vicinamibacterales bacterium]